MGNTMISHNLDFFNYIFAKKCDIFRKNANKFPFILLRERKDDRFFQP